MTISMWPANSLRSAFSRVAYSSAPFSSWIEQGPMTTSRRGSSCRKMRMIRSRLRATVALAASVVGDCAFNSRGVEQPDDFFDV